MDEKKAFGVIAAIGKRAVTDGVDVARFRDASSQEMLVALVNEIGGLPDAMIADFIGSHLAEDAWERTRAKLILAVKLEQGSIKRGLGHEAGRGTHPSR